MRSTCVLNWLLWILVMNIGSNQASQCNPEQHTCLACKIETLHLVCEPNQIVTGFMKAGWRNTDLAAAYTNDTEQCGYLQGDCYAEDTIILQRVKNCMWHQYDCHFILNPFISSIRGPLHNCSTTTTTSVSNLEAMYLMAFDYHCVPRDRIHALCRSEPPPKILLADDTSFVQYLTSVDFPREYAQFNGGIIVEEGQFCSIEIHVSRGYGIRVWSVFMDITNPAESGICQMEHLKLSHPETGSDVNPVVACGKRNFSMDWPYSSLVVEFVVEEMDKRTAKLREGFVLRYGSYALPREADTTTIKATTTAVTERTQTPTTDRQTAVSTNGGPVSTAVLVAILVSALLFLMVTVGALALLLYRRIGLKYSPTQQQHTEKQTEQELDSDSSTVSEIHGYV